MIRRARPAGECGTTLLETLVALFLVGLGVLAVAPMFMLAMQGNATGGDIGQVGALAVDRMERLREAGFDDPPLGVGGDLTSNVTHAVSGLDYFDTSVPGYVVRWSVVSNTVTSGSKIVTVRAIDLDQDRGPQKVATLTTVRGD